MTVTAIAGASFHEYGKITEKVVIRQGHFVVEKDAEVPQLEVVNATSDVKVTANEETVIVVDSSSSSQTSIVSNSNDVFVKGVTEEIVTGTTPASLAKGVTTLNELNGIFANGGYALLDADLEISEKTTLGTKKIVLDLNGHIISSGDEIDDNDYMFVLPENGDLTVMGDGKILGGGRIIDSYGKMTVNGGSFVTRVLGCGTAIVAETGSQLTFNNGANYK